MLNLLLVVVLLEFILKILYSTTYLDIWFYRIQSFFFPEIEPVVLYIYGCISLKMIQQPLWKMETIMNHYEKWPTVEYSLLPINPEKTAALVICFFSLQSDAPDIFLGI